ncbi:MAG: TRAP transporter small permease subunit, partial [Planctomycetota bacterium]|nr:TRAP transporter small permease subunit [Planctomycetota bacterium]
MKIDGDRGLVDQETNEPSPDAKLRPEVNADENLPLASITRGLVMGEKMVAALFLLAVIITMASQVVARYVFGSPFQWSEEVARLALIWMTFVSAAYVMAEGRHIAVDM